MRYANKSWFAGIPRPWAWCCLHVSDYRTVVAAAIVEEVKEDGVLTVRIIASNKTDDVLSANCRTLKASKRAVPADEVAAEPTHSWLFAKLPALPLEKQLFALILQKWLAAQ